MVTCLPKLPSWEPSSISIPKDSCGHPKDGLRTTSGPRLNCTLLPLRNIQILRNMKTLQWPQNTRGDFRHAEALTQQILVLKMSLDIYTVVLLVYFDFIYFTP